MNDPWDVKSVRQGHQYQSCMRLNGVPLLPPVLSKECRKEMQYYKLLAREVEKRIAILRSYVGNDTDSSEDKTDAPELPECEHEEYLSSPSKLETSFIFDNNNIVAVTEDLSPKSNTFTPLSNKLNPKFQSVQDSMLHENFELEVDQELYEVSRTPHRTLEPNELPERDCDFTSQPRKEKEVLTEVETGRKKVQKELIDDLINFDFHLSSHNDEFIPLHQDGPSSLSSKSFTGSLLDLHSESAKDAPKLIRQRSYTVLKPSPQLLAHLEVQSISTGVDVSSISMSESMSNLSLPNKKRRSWDLESAKVKWSSMAMELKKSKIVTKTSTSGVAKTSRKSHVSPLAKSQSQIQEKSRKFINSKLNKSEPVQKQKAIQSPVRNVPSDRTIVKEPAGNKTIVKKTPPKIANSKKEEVPLKESPNTLISSSEDPAAQVRELYEKLQKQQLVQMASLVEKQKREQQLLQQVFEEQNTVLLKQLKTVCPKSSIEMKQAWGDLKDDAERGPVSLSQLINNKTPEHSVPNSPVSKTLTETNNYINKCDNVLRKSRDLTDSIKKLQPKPRSNVKKSESPIQTQPEGNRTRTHSPTSRNTSRRLNYDTSTTSDYENMASPRDYDQMLTDRTNDTMADLNVTFPSDSDECSNFTKVECRKVTTVRACSPVPRSYNGVHSTDTALKNLEYSIQNSMNAMSGRLSPKQNMFRPPTTRERVAATKIVAFAKGYLVRRLMRTERVQATVQTIRDALLCALQLHQDRAGIRGADVDLHRRLIQQITAACYSLHDTFVASSPGERCALLAADRARSQALAARRDVAPHRPTRRTEILDNATLFSLDPLPLVSYLEYPDPETFNADKVRPRYMPSPRRRPWR